MAVGAPDVTLRDLTEQVAPGRSVQHRADRVDLLGAVTMIELKDHGVALAAVNAWMRCQVVHDPSPVLSALFAARSPRARAVPVSILLIVELAVCRAARAATRPAPTRLLVLNGKFLYWALESAAGAPLRPDGDRDVGGGNHRELPREPRAFRGRDSRDFPPTELLGGPHQVAVGTPYVAFLDLNEDESPRLVHRKLGDVALFLFRLTVIEIEHHRIAASAIDAGVREEVGNKQGAVLDAVVRDPCNLAPDVLVAIRQVVRTSIRRLARPAMPLSGPLRHIS